MKRIIMMVLRNILLVPWMWAKLCYHASHVDKLAAEFADELDSLGVRVANLEKKADNVKITGQIRASYKDVDGDKNGHAGQLRNRLFVNGAINEDWTYTGRLQNIQTYTNESGDDDLEMNWAFVSGRVGGVKVDAGRMDFTYSDVVDMRADGVKLVYGDDVKLTGWAYKAASDNYVSGSQFDKEIFGDDGKGNAKDTLVESGDRFYTVGVEANIGVVDTAVRYYNADNWRNQEIWEAAVAGEVVKDLTLKGAYFYGDADDVDSLDNNGWLVGLSYRGAKASEAGSWGLYANWNDRPFATYLIPTSMSGYADAPYASLAEAVNGDGYEGLEVGANVTLAKNIVAGVKYFDFEQREGNKDAQTLWSEVIFTF